MRVSAAKLGGGNLEELHGSRGDSFVSGDGSEGLLFDFKLT